MAYNLRHGRGGKIRYDVHYRNARAVAVANAAGQHLRFDRTAPTLAEFDLFYRYVGTFEAEDLHGLFRLLQDGGGGLGDKTMQQYVIRQIAQTSMSNGDIAIERDAGNVWQLQPRGWKAIELK